MARVAAVECLDDTLDHVVNALAVAAGVVLVGTALFAIPTGFVAFDPRRILVIMEPQPTSPWTLVGATAAALVLGAIILIADLSVVWMLVLGPLMGGWLLVEERQRARRTRSR